MTGQGTMRGPTGSNVGSTATGKWAGDKLPSGYKARQMANFTPEQMNLFQQLFGLVSPESYTGRLAAGDESLFNEMEAPALKQFSGIQGGLASRFSQGGGGRGAMSARRSSGFQNTMNQAAMDFAGDLQSKRQGLQRQAIMDLMGMSNALLGQRPFERSLEKNKTSPWGAMAGKLFGPVGGFVGDLATGDKDYTGTQTGVDTSLDMIKALMKMGG
jgi:hypothetical protein